MRRVGMVGHDELVEQLVSTIRARLLDPLEILLQDPESLEWLAARARGQAISWARDLLGEDDATAMATVMRLVAALYPSEGPFDPAADWWTTPLGQAVLRRAGHPPAPEVVSYSVAGAMLSVTKQGVHDLARRGKLDRHHSSSGVTTNSVRARLLATTTGSPAGKENG